jgi:hypothetical protein
MRGLPVYSINLLQIVAHQIANNLGAYNDGDLDPGYFNCSENQNFIMTPTIGVYSNNLKNLFDFSICSRNAFRNFLITK